MKIKTLVEMKECFAMLREAEKLGKSLSGTDYVRCLSAQTIFEFQLLQHLDKLPAVEVTDADRYKFLRDEFALKADDDEAEFANLAHVSGAAFDKAIDKAMGAS